MVHEYTTEDFMEAIREEAWEDGREEGEKKSQKYVLELIEQGLTAEEIKQQLENK